MKGMSQLLAVAVVLVSASALAEGWRLIRRPHGRPYTHR